MCSGNILFVCEIEDHATKPETMPVSKVSLGKFYVAIGSARRIRITLIHTSALKHLFQKDKNKKNRSPFLTFMNMQS